MARINEAPRPAFEASSAVMTTVVVPAYNEEEGLPVVLKSILETIDEQTEILVVDDGSTDATREIAASFNCRVVAHSRNRGKGEAVRTAIREARGENIVFIDADDTYPAHKIPEMIRLLNSHDMVIGSRKAGHQNIPAFNRIGNAVFRNSIRYCYGFKPYDPLTGFFGAKRRDLAAMQLKAQNFRIESEIAIKGGSMGLKMADLQIEYGRRLGTAKLRGLQDGYTIFATIVRMLPAHSPAAVLVFPGLLLCLLGLAGSLALMDAPVSVGGIGLGFEWFAASLLALLLGVSVSACGLLLLAQGVSKGALRCGAIPALLLAPATRSLLLAAGLAAVIGAMVWTLAQAGSWDRNGDSLAEALLTLTVAATGLQVAGVALLLRGFEPGVRPTDAHRERTSPARSPVVSIESDEGPAQ